MTRPRQALAGLLAEAGVASVEQLRVALAEGLETGERLGEVVLRRGWISEEGLARIIARRWGLTFIERSQISVDEGACSLFPREEAARLGACPFAFKDGVPVVALAEPSEERFAAVRETLGGDCAFLVTTARALASLIEQPDVAMPDPEAAAAAAGPAPATAPPAVALTELEDDSDVALPDPEAAAAAAGSAPATAPATVALTELEDDSDIAMPDPEAAAAAAGSAPATAPPTVALAELEEDFARFVEQVQRLLDERMQSKDQLTRYEQQLAALSEDLARAQEKIRILEAELGQEHQLLHSMKAKLTEFTQSLAQ